MKRVIFLSGHPAMDSLRSIGFDSSTPNTWARWDGSHDAGRPARHSLERLERQEKTKERGALRGGSLARTRGSVHRRIMNNKGKSRIWMIGMGVLAVQGDIFDVLVKRRA